jgi:outer membrane protein TolC
VGACARRDAAVAAYDAALADYRGTVLAAFTQVADVLRAIENDAQTSAAHDDALSAAREGLELAEIRYDASVVGVLDVLIAQQQLQRAVIDVVDARAARLADTARLFAALGGAALPMETTP